MQIKIRRRTPLGGDWHDEGAIEGDVMSMPGVESAAHSLGAIPGDKMIFEALGPPCPERIFFDVYWTDDGRLAVKS